MFRDGAITECSNHVSDFNLPVNWLNERMMLTASYPSSHAYVVSCITIILVLPCNSKIPFTFWFTLVWHAMNVTRPAISCYVATSHTMIYSLLCSNWCCLLVELDMQQAHCKPFSWKWIQITAVLITINWNNYTIIFVVGMNTSLYTRTPFLSGCLLWSI